MFIEIDESLVNLNNIFRVDLHKNELIFTLPNEIESSIFCQNEFEAKKYYQRILNITCKPLAIYDAGFNIEKKDE